MHTEKINYDDVANMEKLIASYKAEGIDFENIKDLKVIVNETPILHKIMWRVFALVDYLICQSFIVN